MQPDQLPADDLSTLDAVLGYLNFSSGAPDSQLFANLDRLYRGLIEIKPSLAPGQEKATPTWQRLGTLLLARLQTLSEENAAFQDATQARSIVHLAHDEALPAYREFHRDLLFHQDDESLYNAFFVGRVYETILREQGQEIQETGESVVDAVLTTLNDFIGHRPVAVLETEQKIEAYPHERLRPVPVYIEGAGVATGRYAELIDGTLAILRDTPEMVLEHAFFDPDSLEELAFDPRAYDFNHPVNRRPNYHFGQWDPSHIDNRGRYRRFIVQQASLDAILARVEHDSSLPHDEALFEASAILAGTILMAAATSGRGPDTHTSETTLASLMPGIATVRDEFYKTLLMRSTDAHPHLIDDARDRQQPFGAARQQLNAELARRRAAQLEHVHLAHAYARMGYAEAAERQAAIIPTASSRIICQIECRLATGQLLLDRGEISAAASLFPEIIDLLHRGIACGAIVDPWNAIGFDGNFSLFPGVQDSVPDHRLDDLVDLMDKIFSILARCWSLAAAADNDEVQTTAGSELLQLATWWDQFAVPTVSGLEAVFAAPLHESAERAATALAAWQSAGTTAGDVAFWRPHADQFDSPKAYVLVVEALLDQRDYVASMGLLMHWLSQSERIELQEAGDWFHSLIERWLGQLLDEPSDDVANVSMTRWELIGKFFDFLEANAEHYWDVPQLELEALLGEADLVDLEEELEATSEEGGDDEDDLYQAAYDGISFRDSTDDGIDADLLGSGENETDYELEYEARRITERLTFLVTLSRLWSRTALAATGNESCRAELSDRLNQWISRALTNRRDLLDLLTQLARHGVAQPTGTFESLLEYDRRVNIKESLLERTTATCRNCASAIWFMHAAGANCNESQLEPGEIEFSVILKAALAGDREALANGWDEWTDQLAQQPLLYIPINRGGDPIQIVATRSRHRSIRLMLGMLPRLGEIERTIELLELAVTTEQTHPLGVRAVTEFADLLQVGQRAVAEAVIASVEQWRKETPAAGDSTVDEDQDLIDSLQVITDTILVIWLAHSQHLRLSILEKATDPKDWKKTAEFVQRFGADLFHQQFMNPGNLRSILQSGAAEWLQDLTERAEDTDDLPTIALINDEAARREACRQFELVIEAVLENHTEYLDYNSTTTQSDRGEMLYTLLDLLRVRVVYDRVAWNVTPVILTHEALVRSRHLSAAAMWQRELATQTVEVADELLDRLRKLQQQHSMRLSTIVGRLEERFVRPLAIDRVRALVKPTIESRRQGEMSPEFAHLEEEVDELTRTPSGVGFDVPEWITSLEDEVDRATTFSGTIEIERLAHEHVAWRWLDRDELDEQLNAISADE